MAAAASSSATSRPSASASISATTMPRTGCCAASPAGRRGPICDPGWRSLSRSSASIYRTISREFSMSLAPVPQNDPKAAYLAQREAIDAAIAGVLDSGWYILGKQTTAFEAEFANAVGSRHGVGVGNGTDALVLALRVLGIGPGKAVATVSHTAVATVAAIEMVGALPILLDIDHDTYTMDPKELKRVLTHQPQGGAIAAIIPVHLYGQPADLAAIAALARR